MNARMILALGAALAGLAVAAGAFGAHMLKGLLAAELLRAFETGVRYQMYHALALILSGWALTEFQGVLFRRAAWLFLFGILLFSGSLYALSLLGLRWLGALTPLGGVLLLGGWLCLVIGFLRNRNPL